MLLGSEAKPFVTEQRTEVSLNASNGEPMILKKTLHFRKFDSSGTTSSMIEFVVYRAPEDLAKVGLVRPDEELSIEDLTKVSQVIGRTNQSITQDFL